MSIQDTATYERKLAEGDTIGALVELDAMIVKVFEEVNAEHGYSPERISELLGLLAASTHLLIMRERLHIPGLW